MLKKIEKCLLFPWKMVNCAAEWVKYCESLHVILTIAIFVVVIIPTYLLFAPVNSIARVMGMVLVSFFVIGILLTILSALGTFVIDLILSVTRLLSNMYDKCNAQMNTVVNHSAYGLVEPEAPCVNLTQVIRRQSEDPYQIIFC